MGRNPYLVSDPLCHYGLAAVAWQLRLVIILSPIAEPESHDDGKENRAPFMRVMLQGFTYTMQIYVMNGTLLSVVTKEIISIRDSSKGKGSESMKAI